MRCHVCGGPLERTVTDLPFKRGAHRTVIVRDLPALVCGQCGEHVLEDDVMARVEALLEGLGDGAELEVIRYAA